MSMFGGGGVGLDVVLLLMNEFFFLLLFLFFIGNFNKLGMWLFYLFFN